MQTKVFLLLLALLYFTALVAADDYILDVTVYYPESKLFKQKNDQMFIRGSALGLNWNNGVPLKHSATNTFTHRLTFSSEAINSTYVSYRSSIGFCSFIIFIKIIM